MATGLATFAGFAALAGLLGLPTSTGSAQFASLLLSLGQFGFQPFYNSASLGSGFHGSFSHHTITHTETKEILFEPKRAVELVTDLF